MQRSFDRSQILRGTDVIGVGQLCANNYFRQSQYSRIKIMRTRSTDTEIIQQRFVRGRLERSLFKQRSSLGKAILFEKQESLLRRLTIGWRRENDGRASNHK